MGPDFRQRDILPPPHFNEPLLDRFAVLYWDTRRCILKRIRNLNWAIDASTSLNAQGGRGPSATDDLRCVLLEVSRHLRKCPRPFTLWDL